MVAEQVGENKKRIENIRVRTGDVKVKAGDNIDVKEVYDDAKQVKTYTVSTTKDIKANSYTINNSNIKIDQKVTKKLSTLQMVKMITMRLMFHN